MSKFKKVKDFFANKEGKVMVLHMSSMSDQSKTFVVTSGVINSLYIEDEQEGFEVQLQDRYGVPYYRPEMFYGQHDFEFRVDYKAFSDTLRVQYKDGSYFIIEIRI